MIANLMRLLMILGVIILSVSYFSDTSDTSHIMKEKIIYRYIPRTLQEEQKEPIPPSEIFKNMFMEPSTWAKSINTYDRRKTEELNRYFVSQYL